MKRLLPFIILIIPSTAPGQDYELIDSVKASGVGFWAGAVSYDLSHIVYGPYAGDSTKPTVEDSLFFLTNEGSVRKKYHIGNHVWAVATTKDGNYTIVGTDNEDVLIFEDTTLIDSGFISGNSKQKRMVAISNDERYFAVGGGQLTIHELDSTTPLTPVYVSINTEWVRAINFSDGNRYCAFGGQLEPTHLTYLGIVDLESMSLAFSDTMEQAEGVNGELRQVAISRDGNRIVGGTFGQEDSKLYYYVREDTSTTIWVLKEEIDYSSSIYWVDMDSSGRLAIVTEQSGGIFLYELDDSSLTLRWVFPEPEPPPPIMDGGARYVSITPDGNRIIATTRGGGAGGSQIFVLDSLANIIFYHRSYAPPKGDGTYEHPDSWYGAISEDGTRITYASWGGYAYFFEKASTGISSEAASVPDEFVLVQNYPNPFNPTTTICFDLPETADVELVIHDILGREVETLVRGRLVSGRHEVVWDATYVPNGVYFITMVSGDFRQTRKVMVLR